MQRTTLTENFYNFRNKFSYNFEPQATKRKNKNKMKQDMKHKKLVSMLVLLMAVVSGAWAADSRVVVATMENGTITAEDVAASGSKTVTLTVTPAADYYITAADITVSKTASEAMARGAAPGYTDKLAVTAKSVDATGKGTYTFNLPEGYGAYVEAVFTKCQAMELGVSISGWTYGGEAGAPSVSGNDSGGKVSYTYAKKGTTKFTAAVPTAAGDYTVKASVPATGHYLAAEATADFTIEQATLSEVMISPAILNYNSQPQTVAVSKVMAGKLVVPEDQYVVEGNTGTAPGSYTVTVTGKGNFKGTAKAQFVIMYVGTLISVVDAETGEVIEGVTISVTVIDELNKLMVIDKLNVPDGAANRKLKVSIPETADGNTVAGIKAGAFSGTNVTDIYLPLTEKPLTIEEGALSATVTIHTPLPLLDDYALMKTLTANFKAMNIVATAVAPNQFWTFSCGVDVELDEELDANIVFYEDNVARFVQLSEDELILRDDIRGIKACNGVLLSGEKGRSYDFVAVPGNQESGSAPAAGKDAKSYGAQNRLEPVIEAKNYPADGYAVLKGNAFHSIKQNDSKVPACKAVLNIK